LPPHIRCVTAAAAIAHERHGPYNYDLVGESLEHDIGDLPGSNIY